MFLTQTPASKSVLPETISQFEAILKSNGITDKVLEVQVCDSGLQEENWAGTTEYVTIKLENSKQKPLNLFVKKKLETNGGYSKLLEEWQVFPKEADFYMEYLPVARDYCRRLGHEEHMDIYPKCYFGDDKQIILENLVVEKGFILLSKVERQDWETSRLAITNLAKHHAISLALISDFGGPEVFFQRFSKLKFERFKKESYIIQLCANFDNGVDTAVKFLEKCRVEGCDRVTAILKSLKGKQLPNIIESLSTDSSVNCLVLNHGDYWNNNMMFREDKNTDKVTEHVAVDFQMIRYASPCFDLAYFLFTSVKPKVRLERFPDLCKLYLESFKQFASELGYPITISLQEFYTDFRKRFYYGFWIGLGFIGYEIIKELGANSKDGMDKLMEEMDMLLIKWNDDRPEKSTEIAESLIEYVNCYEVVVAGTIIQDL